MIKVGSKVEFQNKICLVVEVEINGYLILQPCGESIYSRFSIQASKVNKIMNEGRLEINNSQKYGEILNG